MINSSNLDVLPPEMTYTVPNSPISAGVGHYAVIDDQNMLHMGGNYEYKRNFDYESDLGKLSKTSVLKRKVRSVSCGNFFTGAVTNDGKVYFWGERLGPFFGDKNPKILEPREFPISGRAIKITCGPKTEGRILATFAVILEDRSVFLRMDYLFPDSTNPYSVGTGIKRKISTKLNIKALDISTNGYGLAIISTDGKLYYLGKSLFGDGEDVGITYKDGQIIINPVHIPISEKIKQVSLAFGYIGVISVKGNIYLWGENEYGQLGQGWAPRTEFSEREGGYADEMEYFVDRPRKLLFPRNISFISCQDETTSVIDENGELYRWGRNRGFIDPSQYTGLEDIIVDNVFFEMGYENAERNAVIPRPIQIGIELTDTSMENKFNYVAIGMKMVISTTRDGVVNVWNENKYPDQIFIY
uniref:Regulator of chromosome condensation protein n=1 Tax=Pithovirus LCPAC201 TaxID=2506591 RepID=A0A481Z4R9_9VIRU|nr:MAG: regulator of chromosome condensation protein [Pithovirus LCPAC201]